MSMCRSFLQAANAVARAAGGRTDHGFAVFTDCSRKPYEVQDAAGKIVWQGSAHCCYCARAEAVIKVAAVAA